MEILGVGNMEYAPKRQLKCMCLPILAAHPVHDNLPLAIDLSSKEVTMLKKDGKCISTVLSGAQLGKEKKIERTTRGDTDYAHLSVECIISYAFF